MTKWPAIPKSEQPDPQTGELPYTPQGTTMTADELSSAIAHLIVSAGVSLEVADEGVDKVCDWLDDKVETEPPASS